MPDRLPPSTAFRGQRSRRTRSLRGANDSSAASVPLPGGRAPAATVAVAMTVAAIAWLGLASGCSIARPTSSDDAGSPSTGSPSTGSAPRPPETATEAAELLRVVDGDSVELRIDGREVDVRLDGYNAPELYGPAPDGGPDRQTCNGQAAKSALAELLGSGPVLVVGDQTDRFGRRLADLVVDGGSIDEQMIDRGWGLAIGDDEADRDRMKRAAADRRGLWGGGCGLAQSEGLAIGNIQVDPAGSDRENLNDEWVTVVNRSAAPVDLTGWVIRDDTTSHRFPLSGVVPPGARLTVRSGTGPSSATELHLNETFPVWSNNGETVLLVDPSGVVATWAFVD